MALHFAPVPAGNPPQIHDAIYGCLEVQNGMKLPVKR